MKKDECERVVRFLCHKWREARAASGAQSDHRSFTDFMSWLRQNGYSPYLDFQSDRGARADVEMWFDDEFRQGRRH